MNSTDAKAAVGPYLKGPMLGGPPKRVVQALVEALGDASELLTAATIGSESARSSSLGALAITPEDAVVVLDEKGGLRIERYPVPKLLGTATWTVRVVDVGERIVVALLLPDESLVSLALNPKDARRVLAALPDARHEQAIHLTAVKVLVTPGATFGPKAAVTLTATSSGFRLQSASKPSLVEYFPRSEITAVSVDGVDQVQLRPSVLATAAFGVAGLAARKREQRSYLVIATDDGDGVYEVDGVLPTELRARLSPFTKGLNVSPPAPAETISDPIDKLQRLAELRDQGVVTNEEFEETKAELLRQLRT